ncbi:RICIN domain-containing protein [Amycolatopsis sp. cg5]|uniref:RICIN domain-containing protein n=1 Tax=Amycolatopsis sp. cg5 TaxID=3238802 RepID=UPI0035251E06
MKRIVSVIVALVVGIAGLSVPAHAVAANQLVNARYGECLSLASSPGVNGTQLGHYACDGASDQFWFLDPSGTVSIFGSVYSAFRLRNLASGMCADVAGNGTILVQHYCNSLDQQRFRAAVVLQPDRRPAVVHRLT